MEDKVIFLSLPPPIFHVVLECPQNFWNRFLRGIRGKQRSWELINISLPQQIKSPSDVHLCTKYALTGNILYVSKILYDGFRKTVTLCSSYLRAYNFPSAVSP